MRRFGTSANPGLAGDRPMLNPPAGTFSAELPPNSDGCCCNPRRE